MNRTSMNRFTLLDFEGSVDDIIKVLRTLPAGSRLEFSEEVYRDPWGRGAENVDVLIVKENK